MGGLVRAKNVVRSAIARRRRSRLATTLHRAASFFEAAWHNEDTELSTNGELAVLKRLRSADFRLAIDVGANVGHWLKAATENWPRCAFHAFEVAPQTYLELVKHASSIGDGRVELHNLGLADQAGVETMYYFPAHPELTCDRPRHDGQPSELFEARLTTLDAFSRERGIDNVDFLKVDVEGAEHRVLKGAHELLAAERISCIQFEYGAFSIQTRFLLKDYFVLLADRYHIGKIYPDHVAFDDYEWTAETFRFSNYLCVARQRTDLMSLLNG